MKINAAGGLSPTGAKSASRTGGQGGFSVGQAGASAPASTVARASAPVGVAGLEALLALQEAEGPLERKRRAVRRAGRLLDVLDEVKLALLGGETSAPALQRLAQAVREERSGTEDARLEGILNEIESRAAVELAKAEMSRLAA